MRSIYVNVISTRAVGMLKNMIDDTQSSETMVIRIQILLPDIVINFLEQMDNVDSYIKNIENAINSIVGDKEFLVDDLNLINYLDQICVIKLMFDFLNISANVPTRGFNERESKFGNMIADAISDPTCHCMIFEFSNLTDGGSVYGLKLEANRIINKLNLPLKCITMKPPKCFPKRIINEFISHDNNCYCHDDSYCYNCEDYHIQIKRGRISSPQDNFVCIVIVNEDIHKKYKRIFEGQYTNGGKFRVTTVDGHNKEQRQIAYPDYRCKNVFPHLKMREWKSFELDTDFIVENIKLLPEKYRAGTVVRIASQLPYAKSKCISL